MAEAQQTERLRIEELQRLASDALVEAGASATQGAPVAVRLVQADLDAIPSHGVARIPLYCAHLWHGRIAGRIEPDVIQVSPAAIRVDGAPIGLLAFGGAGQAALRFAAGAGQNGRNAGLALLYPGCEAMLPTEREQASDQRAPVLLLHGDADPANLPADCAALAERLAQSAPVLRQQIAMAGYAWDRVPYRLQEEVALRWPGRPGAHVRAGFLQEAAEYVAAQVEAFFTAVLPAEPR